MDDVIDYTVKYCFYMKDKFGGMPDFDIDSLNVQAYELMTGI